MITKLFKMFSNITLMLSMIISISMANAQSTSKFAYGADIGWLSLLEDRGVIWVDQENNTKDALELMKEKGIDSVRLRVMVNPPSSGIGGDQTEQSDFWLIGHTNKYQVVAAAVRAQNIGMRVMVDFHFSDIWADPANQIKPAAWVGFNEDQLTNAVYNHVYDVMTALKNANVTPEWVQVGNEIDPGILVSDEQNPNGYNVIADVSGSIEAFASLARFLNRGYDAVKAVSPNSKVITHVASNSTAPWFFNKFLNEYQGKTDILAVSFYPYWLEQPYWELMDTLSDNLTAVSDLAGSNHEVMVTEIGGLQDEPNDSYWTVKKTIDIVKALPNGSGVFYWEPAAHSSVNGGYALGATTAVSENVLQFTAAMDAFIHDEIPIFDRTKNYRIVNRNSGKALNVVGGSNENGAKIEQYTYGGWESQKWQFSAMGTDLYTIKNINSQQLMDIFGASSAEGAKNIQWYDNGGLNQQWQIISTGETGFYQIMNIKSQKLLDITGASTLDGALNIQWYNNGGFNQHWQIIEN
ncbi:MAG: glycosyl hydrolase 53 family protein [Colwellia sp.]